MSLKQAIDFARQEPDGAYATELRRRMEAGEFDEQAIKEGVTIPGRPALPTAPVPEIEEPVEPLPFELHKPVEERESLVGRVSGAAAEQAKKGIETLGEFARGAPAPRAVKGAAEIGLTPIRALEPVLGELVEGSQGVIDFLSSPIQKALKGQLEKRMQEDPAVRDAAIDFQNSLLAAAKNVQETIQRAGEAKEALPSTIKEPLEALLPAGELALEATGIGEVAAGLRPIAKQALKKLEDTTKTALKQSAEAFKARGVARTAAEIEEANIMLDKFVTEILQPPKAAQVGKVGVSPEAVTEASKVIGKAKTFKEVDTQLETVANDAIATVNAKIAASPDLEISNDYLRPLQNRVEELRKDVTKSHIADKYDAILEGEMQNLRNSNGVYPLLTAQVRKRQLNEDLSKFFGKKDPTDLEVAETQARNLIRRGLMEQIERTGGKEIGDMNRVYANLSDSRGFLKTVDERFKKQITPTFFQRIVEKIPIVKGLLKGSPDAIIGTRSGQLIDILPQRTKDIEELRKKIEKLGGEIGLPPSKAPDVETLTQKKFVEELVKEQ